MAFGIFAGPCGRTIAGAISATALVLPAAGAETAPSIPDFSGVWARMTFGVEPPPSGPGPLTNLVRRPNGASDGTQLVGDYNNPILQPWAAAEVKRKGEISRTGNAFPDPANQCAPQGPPYILRQQQIQLLQEKDQVTILYMLDHHVRRVRLNDSHPEEVTPSWTGDSIGHYEGDTLVVDTIGLKVGPITMADQFGSPQSEAMHVVERYRLVDYETMLKAFEQNERDYGKVDGPNGNGVFYDPDYRGKGLQVTYTVEDPKVFTMPWGATVTYRKAGSPWVEQICAENTYEYYDEKHTDVPKADAPDF